MLKVWKIKLFYYEIKVGGLLPLKFAKPVFKIFGFPFCLSYDFTIQLKICRDVF